jgi:1-phosphatidylinositol phosphodiesterase
MWVIKDDTRLSELSIPGTHQTMARFGGSYPDIADCQRMTLWDQLMSGVRVLDIRCRHVGRLFNIHHGPVFQHATYDNVLDDVVRFLKEHPGETVLMRVKEEHTPAATTRTFEETFRDRYWKTRPGTFWEGTSDNPRLGDLRGKIVVLQDFAREGEANTVSGIRP